MIIDERQSAKTFVFVTRAGSADVGRFAEFSPDFPPGGPQYQTWYCRLP
jgi:hypothetical protein